ncbi:MAG: iron uptake porin [Cyanobacteriota bacterium]|nr:iron uptake porin [Cyanobacteriota bacterium]
MIRFSSLVVLTSTTTLICPSIAHGAALNLEAVNDYAGVKVHQAAQTDPIRSMHQFIDVRPSDWAYQALSTLAERYGCIAGFPNGDVKGRQALSRYEAAALLNSCLDHISETTDELRLLLKEFERELAVLKGRIDGLEAKAGELAATSFSTTTKLGGTAVFVIGANAFSGSARQEVKTARDLEGSAVFNYDLQLNVDTSFKGRDLLKTVLRAGNFADSAFGNSGLNQLEVAFQEDCGSKPDGTVVDCRDVVAIDKIFYQFPIGQQWTATIGGRVGQEDMLAVWPSVYPSDTILNVFTLNGAPVAYNKNLGAGGGLWWTSGAWSLSANYVAAMGDQGNPGLGGLGTHHAQGSGTAQLAYATDNWVIAALYSYLQQNTEVPGSTPFASGDWQNTGPGHVNAFALSGYWQPSHADWLPSISLGWGYNHYNYYQPVPTGSLKTSQSWSVGLQWEDAFSNGNALGFAVGQPVFATGLSGAATPKDGNYAFELWYKVQATDHISVTPAIFYLSRPEGQDTPSGKSFHNLGAILKTTFRL